MFKAKAVLTLSDGVIKQLGNELKRNLRIYVKTL